MPELPDRPTTPPGAPLLPEERVHAALRRAAQLQAEAAERLEGDVRARIAPQAGDAGEPGFRREDVEAAAVQAGISPEYIQQALVEQDTLGDHATELAPWMDRMANRMLRTRQRSMELSRTMDAEPRAVLDAMQRVFPAPPYGLMLTDCVGPAPLEGGVLVFQLPGMSALMSNAASGSFAYTAAAVDLLQLHATLHAVPAGERNRCTVTLRGDLRTSARRNVWAGIGLSGVGGTIGGLIGGAVVGAASGGVIPLLAAGVALGAAGFGGASAVGYGAAYRHYLRKMIRELETLLKVVDTNARTGGGFGAPHLPAGRGDTDGMAGLLGSL